jgi:hypothetical protein
MSNRFTVKRLRENLEEMNQRLAEAGSEIQFLLSPRNNYQAVDEIAVDREGKRIGSGCVRNVGCGTSREVDGYCWDRFYQIINQIDRDAKDAEIAALKSEIAQLRDKALEQ